MEALGRRGGIAPVYTTDHVNAENSTSTDRKCLLMLPFGTVHDSKLLGKVMVPHLGIKFPSSIEHKGALKTSESLIRILGQINPLYVFTQLSSKINFNIIPPSMLRLFSWALPFKFYDRN
jgi:hypothetical protein